MNLMRHDSTPAEGGDSDKTLSLTVSCPGKVLVVGGYLVLKKPNLGLVLSTTARFYTKIEWQEDSLSNQENSLRISVLSPQFDQELDMNVSYDGGNRMRLTSTADDRNRSKYVEQAVAYGYAAAINLMGRQQNGIDLLELLTGNVQLAFKQIRMILRLHFQFSPSGFQVASFAEYSEDEYQHIVQVVAVAKLFKLDHSKVMRLWGELYTESSTLKGGHYDIIREISRKGISAIRFADDDNVANVVRDMSPGARLLLEARGKEKSENFEKEESIFKHVCRHHAGYRLRIEIKADNDFYSQQGYLRERDLPQTRESLHVIPHCNPLIKNTKTGRIQKTGLGSSAAMVTSIVASFLGMFNKNLVSSLETDCEETNPLLNTLNVVSQLAHSSAQGKVGSGFDVCSAVFGGMLYSRYNSQNIEVMVQCEITEKTITLPASDSMLYYYLKGLDCTIEPFQLPPGFSMMCGDVYGGSETPSMANKVMKWLDQGKESNLELWNQLKCANIRIVHHLFRLKELSVSMSLDYTQALKRFGKNAVLQETASGQISVTMGEILQVRETCECIRALFRKIGSLANVSIEPKQQTDLCDQTMKQPGVLMCAVPGAGGYDAIFAIAVDQSRSMVEKLWESKSVMPLLLEEFTSHPGVRFSLH